jgi:hypothetical protein
MTISGCGKTASESGAGAGGGSGGGSGGVTGNSVTISGVVTASSADLAQLGSGVSTLSVDDNAVDLKSAGVPESSIKALSLKPLAVSDTTIKVGPLNKDGSITETTSAKVNADGTYSVKVDNYDSTKTYGAVVSKTSDATKKTLEQKVIYPKPTNNEIKGSDAAISPQTTLVVGMIIKEIVKVLESGNIPPDIIANVKAAIITAVDSLISSGAITVTTVRDSTTTENSRLNEAVDKAASNTTIAGKLDSIEGAARLEIAKGAKDIDSAKGAIYELFKAMMGKAEGIPEEIVNGLAQAYLDGVTKTLAEITTAANQAVFDKAQQKEVSGSLTSKQLGEQISFMLGYVYGKILDNPENKDKMPDGVRKVIEATFPKEEWVSKTISDVTSFTVPQMLIEVFALPHMTGLVDTTKYSINSPKIANLLGLMPKGLDTPKVMHAELRINSFEDWENFRPDPSKQGEQKPRIQQALSSWVDVGSVSGNPTETQGYTCYLTYLTANSTKTVQYKERTDKEMREDGPPPGWKVFSIEPWGDPQQGAGTKITDFIAGKATITVKDASGNVVDTEEETILDINLSKVELTLNTPKQGWIDQINNLSQFPKGSQPEFSWELKSIGTTVPEGYRLGYVINVIKGEFKQMGDRTEFYSNWSDPNSRIYDSWDKQDFPKAIVGETTRWTIPTALNFDGICEFGLTVVIINKKTGQPSVEGPHQGGLFVVGSPTIPDAFKNQFKEQYKTDFTAPQQIDLSKKEFTLTGKVHKNLLDRFPAKTAKVLLYREQYDSTMGFKLTPVEGISAVSLADVSGQDYKTFSLKFSGAVLGTNYGSYIPILYVDTTGNGTLDFDKEEHERSQAMIEYREWGTEVHYPDGGGPLSDKQNVFNFIYWGDSF